MRNKGDTKTQRQYEDEVMLRNIYREAYLMGEMTHEEASCSLIRILCFGKTMAESLIIKWDKEPRLSRARKETLSARDRRLKRKTSLEKKILAQREKKDKNKGTDKEN